MSAPSIRLPDITGLKLWHDPIAFALYGTLALTPYSRKEKARRRAASRVAKMSRRRNR